MSISDFVADRMQKFWAKREQEYWERVNYVAERNLEPTHGAYGSNQGMGVQGYTIKGCSGVVFLRDEDVKEAKARFDAGKGEEAQESEC